MFDFHNLAVYEKARIFYRDIASMLRAHKGVDFSLQDQLRRASLSIVLNIAEGSGRSTNNDKKHFFVISRGSVYECVALLEIFRDEQYVSDTEFAVFINVLEELSKMLYALIKSYS